MCFARSDPGQVGLVALDPLHREIQVAAQRHEVVVAEDDLEAGQPAVELGQLHRVGAVQRNGSQPQ
jgi:hypothetical protein